MLEKKVTRKEFLLGVLSVGGILLASKIHPLVKKVASSQQSKKDNSYGNFSYGGAGKENA